MQHHIIKSLAALALGTMLLVACDAALDHIDSIDAARNKKQ